uniref:Uncharacterized protein n=1 Tax=Rhizophora mucronata TaxID=61149 RepID=A0A2P2R462_RHIMU
MTDYQGSEM